MTQYNNFDETARKDLDTLHKVIRLVNLNTKNQSDTRSRNTSGIYYPVLSRGNVVRCEFTGIGSEINDTHYGIVWNAAPNSESITIIPMSSEFAEDSITRFCIGVIPNFDTTKGSVPSYVYMNKMMEVSRSRIIPWVYSDASGVSQIVSATTPQIERIKEGIIILYADHPYLIDSIKNLQLPIQYQPDILNYGYRAVVNLTIDKTNKKEYTANFKTLSGTNLEIKMFFPRYDASVRPLCKKIKYDTDHYKFRNNIVKGLFSGDRDKTKEAENIIDELYRQCQAQQPSTTS